MCVNKLSIRRQLLLLSFEREREIGFMSDKLFFVIVEKRNIITKIIHVRKRKETHKSKNT